MKTIERKRKRTGPNPIVFQRVHDSLKDRICSMEQRSHSPLPSEMDLAKTYECSRVTIRRVLATLEKEGQVERLPGKGTFVLGAGDPKKRKSQHRILWYLRSELMQANQPYMFSRAILSALQTLVETKTENLQLYTDWTNPMPQDPKSFATWVKRQQADVIVLRPISFGFDELLRCSETGTPIVTWGREVKSDRMDSVSVDYYNDVKRAMNLLADLGHTRIAYIGTTDYDEPTRLRWQAYKDVLKERGLPDVYTPCPNVRYETVYKYARALIGQNDTRPTALVTGGEWFDWPCLQAISASGLRIPQDISVLATDDFEQAEHYYPPISVIRQPISLLVQQALEVARNRMTSPASPAQHVLLSSDIVLRQSVDKVLQ